jgi:hypothetical protein
LKADRIPYEKMLLDGLKVFLAEVKFSGARVKVRDLEAITQWKINDAAVRINLSKGELRLGWSSHRRRWWVGTMYWQKGSYDASRDDTHYSESVEKMEDQVRKLYNELK